MKPTAVYFASLNFHQDCKDLLDREFTLRTLPTPTQLDQESLSAAELVFAPLGWSWGESVFSKMPRLRVIASNTTGHPHIDVKAAGKRGIAVITLKGQHEFLDSISSTAEHTVGLMIALTRNYRSALRSIEEGNWNRFPHAGEKMLSRSEVGIVGLGRLGKKVAYYCSALGMNVAGYDPHVTDGVRNVVQKASLEELVASVDIVTVHVPHEPATERMFDKELFRVFKRGSFFVNTARGELVDTGALLDVLKSGRLAGAALDVLDDEFNPTFDLKNSSVWQHALGEMNLILTPHIGGSTRDAWRDTQLFVIKEAIEFFDKDKQTHAL